MSEIPAVAPVGVTVTSEGRQGCETLVLRFDGAPDRAVGVEIAGGDSTMIAALSREEAHRPATLLASATA